MGSIKPADESEEAEKHFDPEDDEEEDESMQSNEPEAEVSEGPAVIHVAPRPKSAPKRDPRLETLQQSVAALRVEMQNLIQNLIQGQGPLQPQPINRPAAPEDVTGKGKLPRDETLFSTVQWTDVPKDGNCVWHSINVHAGESQDLAINQVAEGGKRQTGWPIGSDLSYVVP